MKDDATEKAVSLLTELGFTCSLDTGSTVEYCLGDLVVDITGGQVPVRFYDTDLDPAYGTFRIDEEILSGESVYRYTLDSLLQSIARMKTFLENVRKLLAPDLVFLRERYRPFFGPEKTHYVFRPLPVTDVRDITVAQKDRSSVWIGATGMHEFFMRLERRHLSCADPESKEHVDAFKGQIVTTISKLDALLDEFRQIKR